MGNMQVRILGNEILNELAFMNGMVIPDQNDLARNNPQHLFQESYNLFRRTGCACKSAWSA